MKTAREECWLPRPGSWEEAVDPYDVQCSRKKPMLAKDDQREKPLPIAVERQRSVRIPASL